MKDSVSTLASIAISSLYPTWFRWKSALSHRQLLFLVLLYIPHGSDERCLWVPWRAPKLRFISHMVQMKANILPPSRHLYRLYIPHGSDESRLNRLFSPPFVCFISHMVQMKVPSIINVSPCFTFFISHMVQMKVDFVEVCIASNSNFISHMVQMKVYFVVLILSVDSAFISHMVQMKVLCLLMLIVLSVVFISHMVQMKGRSPKASNIFKTRLYIPHGSDERRIFDWLCQIIYILYIPHGSDESFLKSSVSPFISPALYPTWFRWKKRLKNKTNQTRFSLYPTWFRWKLVQAWLFWLRNSTLYPTWFRWKSDNKRHLS